MSYIISRTVFPLSPLLNRKIKVGTTLFICILRYGIRASIVMRAFAGRSQNQNRVTAIIVETSDDFDFDFFFEQ